MSGKIKFKPINIELLEYTLDKHTAFAEHFVNTGDRNSFNTTLCHFFVSSLLERRLYYADSICHQLLRHHDTEEFNFLRRSLTEIELDHRLYSFYRDHTNHTLLVFLLGAYLFERVPVFKKFYKEQCLKERDKLRADIPDVQRYPSALDSDFMFRWMYVALMHDFGYTFSEIDVDYTKELCPLLPRSLRILDRFFNEYIKYWFIDDKTGGWEDHIIDLHQQLNLKMKIPKLHASNKVNEKTIASTYNWLVTCNPLRDISSLFETSNVFEIFDMYSDAICPRYTGHFETYFYELANKGVLRANRWFREFDHGILSALIYAKMFSYAFFACNAISNYDVTPLHSTRLRAMIEHIRQGLRGFLYRKESTYSQFAAIAWAIALHNIRPRSGPVFKGSGSDALAKPVAEIIDERKRIEKFNSEVFPISPRDNFLACLLFLVDTIQDWDRDRLGLVKYRGTSTPSLQNYEYSIRVHSGNIYITHLSNEATEARIAAIKGDLELLSPEITKLIKFEEGIPEGHFFNLPKWSQDDTRLSIGFTMGLPPEYINIQY